MPKTLEHRPALQFSSWPFLPSLQSEVADLMDRFDGLRAEIGPRLVPAIDMSETDEAVEIVAEVPGLTADQIDASIVQDRLVLKGGREEEKEESGKDWHTIERRSGAFRRVIPLGFVPAPDGMTAKLSNGVLRLRIAKPSEVKETAHKIAIDAA
ncbi:Hsp20/alpha crystallin family protein [uncultured Jannaschia sp.]|uniref:Hsp20/alpha crystallin family protein n=1 Tax=uncultured Jannaschia sp. TaxID=293347 RepID=UPI00263671FB|nr:Hsp20/alpha crystallin family protein [uncultured Jannaschia sp.]